MTPAPMTAAPMTLHRAAFILTMTDEPELLLDSGETAPVFSAAEIAAARRLSARATAPL